MFNRSAPIAAPVQRARSLRALFTLLSYPLPAVPSVKRAPQCPQGGHQYSSTQVRFTPESGYWAQPRARFVPDGVVGISDVKCNSPRTRGSLRVQDCMTSVAMTLGSSAVHSLGSGLSCKTTNLCNCN